MVSSFQRRLVLVGPPQGQQPVTELPACWWVCCWGHPSVHLSLRPLPYLPAHLCLSPSIPAPPPPTRPPLSPAASASIRATHAQPLSPGVSLPSYPLPSHRGPAAPEPPPPRPAGRRYWTSRRHGEGHLRQERNSFAGEAPLTVHDMVMGTAIRCTTQVALGSKHSNGWHLLTYMEYYEQCRRAANAFLKGRPALLRLRAAPSLLLRLRAAPTFSLLRLRAAPTRSLLRRRAPPTYLHPPAPARRSDGPFLRLRATPSGLQSFPAALARCSFPSARAHVPSAFLVWLVSVVRLPEFLSSNPSPANTRVFLLKLLSLTHQDIYIKYVGLFVKKIYIASRASVSPSVK